MTATVAAARLLAIMGSGETTPTMVKVHRGLFERLGPAPVRAVLMDTPYGFQSNAADISARATGYFKESIGRDVEVASLLRTEGVSTLSLEAALARVAEADWLFSGPGSPTYALRQWRPTVVPHLLAEKLAQGGCIVFSSAASLTLGRFTVPVYEIYKSGADPVWVEGLDLLGPYGLQVAVIPHYDNAEGGTHDTRYCYLGEARLSAMEESLPEEAWVLGVDEHTACIFDLGAGKLSTAGLGGVTVRRRGRSVTVGTGKTLSIEELTGLAFGRSEAGRSRGSARGGTPESASSSGEALEGAGSGRGSSVGDGRGDEPTGGSTGSAPPHGGASPLLADVSRLNADFDRAVAARDAGAATEAVLDLEEVVHGWSADTFQSDELDRARAALRRMIVRLGGAAGEGLRDPRETAAHWVEALLAERAQARESRRYADADRIRDNLLAAGVEVRDTPAGTEWDLRDAKSATVAG